MIINLRNIINDFSGSNKIQKGLFDMLICFTNVNSYMRPVCINRVIKIHFSRENIINTKLVFEIEINRQDSIGLQM